MNKSLVLHISWVELWECLPLKWNVVLASVHRHTLFTLQNFILSDMESVVEKANIIAAAVIELASESY